MSWLPVNEESHFPIQNIPFGVFSTATSKPHVGTAIGDFVVDLSLLYNAGLFSDLGFASNVFEESTLNSFIGLDRTFWRATRARIIDLLSVNGADKRLSSDETLRNSAIIPANHVTMHLPATIGDYTDFYSSREHATNVGVMFRGVDNALQPNWLHLPVGYHGRSSSIVVSGTDVVRPSGQLQANREDPSKGSVFGSCKLMDFELEMGFFVGGAGNAQGKPIKIADAEASIFGVVLLNDWSARDIQAWEYVPLGPFTAKNFATSISCWIVTLDALDDFRCSTSAGPVQDNPVPLPYLVDPEYARSTFDVKLEVCTVFCG
jgi:fumarylacetoacetase